MNVIIDTSVWIDFFNGAAHPEVESALKEGRVFLTPLIASELMSGTRSSAEESKLLAWIDHLPYVDASFSHWIEVGRLRNKCRKKGISISTPDAHIAQAAVDISASLISRDRIFEKIKPFVQAPIQILE